MATVHRPEGELPPAGLARSADLHQEGASCTKTFAKVAIVALSIIGVAACFALLSVAAAALLSGVVMLTGSLVFNYISTGNFFPECCCSGSVSRRSSAPAATVHHIHHGGPRSRSVGYLGTGSDAAYRWDIDDDDVHWAAASPLPPPTGDAAGLFDHEEGSLVVHRRHPSLRGDGGSDRVRRLSGRAPLRADTFTPLADANSRGGGHATHAAVGGGWTAARPLPPPSSSGQRSFRGSSTGSYSRSGGEPPIPRGMSIVVGGGYAARSGPPIPQGTHVVPGSG